MILSVILMTASVPVPRRGGQFNSSWATQIQSHASRWTGARSVLYEDGLGDTKFGLGTSGKAPRLGEKTYEHGIGVNARSVIRFNCLPEKGFSPISAWTETWMVPGRRDVPRNRGTNIVRDGGRGWAKRRVPRGRPGARPSLT